jgi:hypothetical protein
VSITRVLLGSLPGLLGDIVRLVIGTDPEFELVGDAIETSDLVDRMAALDAEVLVVVVPEARDLERLASTVFRRRAAKGVVAIREGGRVGECHRADAPAVRISGLSADSLLALLRYAAGTGRRPRATDD